MNKLVSICLLFVSLVMFGCGQKSQSGGILGLSQSDKIQTNLSSTQNVSYNNNDKNEGLEVNFELEWTKDFESAKQGSLILDRLKSFSLPEFIKPDTRNLFAGFIALDLIRPRSETSLPKEIRCYYTQNSADKEFEFRFCSERNVEISMSKFEKYETSAINLINKNQRASLIFELEPGDEIHAFYSYPIKKGEQGKLDELFKAIVTITLLK